MDNTQIDTLRLNGVYSIDQFERDIKEIGSYPEANKLLAAARLVQARTEFVSHCKFVVKQETAPAFTASLLTVVRKLEHNKHLAAIANKIINN